MKHKLKEYAKKIGVVASLIALAGFVIRMEMGIVAKDQEVAQTSIWQTLSQVSWKQKKDTKGDYEVDYPVFSPQIHAMEGREITVTGYIVPLTVHNVGDNFIVISAYPVRSCFFCGGAGPETVMEIYPKNGDKSHFLEKITFKGRLELNADDPEHLIYLLKDAQISFEETN